MPCAAASLAVLPPTIARLLLAQVVALAQHLAAAAASLRSPPLRPRTSVHPTGEKRCSHLAHP